MRGDTYDTSVEAVELCIGNGTEEGEGVDGDVARLG